jgi:hypothetical protein
LLFCDYPLIIKNYFMLFFVVILGTLHWAAARNHNPAISLFGGWGLGWTGNFFGGGLVLGGFVWFFITTPGLFTAGLAGGELSTLFSAGGLSALAVARLAGTFWQNRTRFAISLCGPLADLSFTMLGVDAARRLLAWLLDAWRGFTFYVLRLRLKKFRRNVPNHKQEV